MQKSLFILLLCAISGFSMAQTGNRDNIPQGQYQFPGTIHAVDTTSRVININQEIFQLSERVIISDSSGKRYNFSALEKGMHVNVFVDTRQEKLPRNAIKQLQIIIN